MATEIKDEQLAGLLDKVAILINSKDTDLEVLQNTNTAVRENMLAEQAKAGEAYKTVYVLHKQLKSLSNLLTKDSIKQMDRNELLKTIAIASGMVTNSKNVANKYLTR